MVFAGGGGVQTELGASFFPPNLIGSKVTLQRFYKTNMHLCRVSLSILVYKLGLIDSLRVILYTLHVTLCFPFKTSKITTAYIEMLIMGTFDIE